VPLFRGSSRFESLVLSDHSRKVTCECNDEEILMMMMMDDPAVFQGSDLTMKRNTAEPQN